VASRTGGLPRGAAPSTAGTCEPPVYPTSFAPGRPFETNFYSTLKRAPGRLARLSGPASGACRAPEPDHPAAGGPAPHGRAARPGGSVRSVRACLAHRASARSGSSWPGQPALVARVCRRRPPGAPSQSCQAGKAPRRPPQDTVNTWSREPAAARDPQPMPPASPRLVPPSRRCARRGGQRGTPCLLPVRDVLLRLAAASGMRQRAPPKISMSLVAVPATISYAVLATQSCWAAPAARQLRLQRQQRVIRRACHPEQLGCAGR
jgi:hypothetical protein